MQGWKRDWPRTDSDGKEMNYPCSSVFIRGLYRFFGILFEHLWWAPRRLLQKGLATDGHG